MVIVYTIFMFCICCWAVNLALVAAISRILGGISPGDSDRRMILTIAFIPVIGNALLLVVVLLLGGEKFLEGEAGASGFNLLFGYIPEEHPPEPIGIHEYLPDVEEKVDND